MSKPMTDDTNRCAAYDRLPIRYVAACRMPSSARLTRIVGTTSSAARRPRPSGPRILAIRMPLRKLATSPTTLLATMSHVSRRKERRTPPSGRVSRCSLDIPRSPFITPSRTTRRSRRTSPWTPPGVVLAPAPGPSSPRDSVVSNPPPDRGRGLARRLEPPAGRLVHRRGQDLRHARGQVRPQVLAQHERPPRLAHRPQALRVGAQRPDGAGQRIRILRRDHDAAARTGDELTRLPGNTADHRHARAHDLEEFGRQDLPEHRQVPQRDDADVRGAVEPHQRGARLLP